MTPKPKDTDPYEDWKAYADRRLANLILGAVLGGLFGAIAAATLIVLLVRGLS